MKICHVTQQIPERASYRYRVLIPGARLTDMGHEVGVDETPNADAVNVYHKHNPTHPEKVVRHGGVVDITDDHWRADAPLYAEDRARIYTDMVRAADRVTCSSRALQDVVWKRTGREAYYVPDPWEFDEVPRRSFGVESVLWFGHESNFQTLRGVELDCPLECVTGVQRPGAEDNMRMTPWSLDGLRAAFARHDTAILPSHAWGVAKNANRAISAIRQGLFVIADATPAIEELQDFVYVTDDILKGIQWARSHPDEVDTMVAAGQAYVARWFSPDEAAARWLEVLEDVQRGDRGLGAEAGAAVAGAGA